ncbi:MAG: hypothetical protein VYA84_15250 [Planctomycetota bacterium]|nr:hypothetical protein [Planctomycetota bacterium]
MRILNPIGLIAALMILVLMIVGCLPEPGPPVVRGPINTSTASQLQSSLRASKGTSFQVEHELPVKGDAENKSFTANWLLGNLLKNNSQLQIKPPADWTDVEVVQAVEVVLAAHQTKPWYEQIDATVLRLVREVIQDDQVDLVSDLAPETPYEVSVKIKHHSSEWFVQVQVLIVSADGINVGF